MQMGALGSLLGGNNMGLISSVLGGAGGATGGLGGMLGGKKNENTAATPQNSMYPALCSQVPQGIMGQVPGLR